MAPWNRQGAEDVDKMTTGVDPGLIFGICFAVLCLIIGFLIWYCLIRKNNNTIEFAKTEKREDGENLIITED